MFDRLVEKTQLEQALRRSRIVLLIGARQVGKTTLARNYLSPQSSAYFDLENPADLARLSEPMTALSPLTGLVVIDEIQRMPNLFPVLRVLADRVPLPAKFLILGSASPAALRQASESLTGRIEVIELQGLRPFDVGEQSLDQLWRRGSFPDSFSAATEEDSNRWRLQYIRNLASRELPEFGVRLPSASVQRFLSLVAHAHGQLWKSADPARTLGISESTVRKYIGVLSDALLIRVLQPWHENLSKRQVKTPKVYFRDSGIAHTLLGIEDEAGLLRNPRVGTSWEGLVIETVVQSLDNLIQPYFWRTSAGAELDLFFEYKGKRIGIEVKRSDAPTITPSMRTALEDLQLDRLLVFYPGETEYSLGEKVEIIPFKKFVDQPRLM